MILYQMRYIRYGADEVRYAATATGRRLYRLSLAFIMRIVWLRALCD